MPTLPADQVALGYVEGWRGRILHWIRTAENGRLARCKIKDPSWRELAGVERGHLENIIPDFPVVNKKVPPVRSGT